MPLARTPIAPTTSASPGSNSTDFPAAIAAFRRALEIDPALALARLNLGIALFYGGEPEAARKELEAAKAALPDRPQPDYVLGLIARAADRPDDAVSAFTRVRELDPTDVGAAINLGQLLVQQRKFDEAIKLLRPAVEAEPFNATAAYGLATALVRSGAADEGRVAMDKFQKLRESGYAVTFSQAYLEQGRYAEAIASTGAEAGLVNEAMPDVRLVDLGTVATYPAAADPGGLTLADLDGDGDVDLVDAGAAGLKLYRNDGGKFTAMPLDAALAAPATAAIAGDADNDGDADLLVLRASGVTLLRQEAKTSFADATSSAGLSGATGAMRTAAWLDADHDGDLDLLIGGASAAARLLRNNGKGAFEDVTDRRRPRATRKPSAPWSRPTTTTAATSTSCWCGRRRRPRSTATCATAPSRTWPVMSAWRSRVPPAWRRQVTSTRTGSSTSFTPAATPVSSR